MTLGISLLANKTLIKKENASATKTKYADCIETEVYLDKSEKSKARPSGIAKKENQFNDKGLKKLEQYFRHDERPWHKGGIFRTVYTYDDKDRVTAKKYFGETRNTTLDPVPVWLQEGIIRARYLLWS